jgi:cell division protein FtsB
VNARRLVNWTYALMFIVVAAFSGMFFFRTYQEYARLRGLEAESERRLAAARQRLSQQQEELQRLRTDPAFVEKVIRRHLHYARPDELLFQFDPKYER